MKSRARRNMVLTANTFLAFFSSVSDAQLQFLAFLCRKTCVCCTLYGAEPCSGRTSCHTPKCCGLSVHTGIKRYPVILGQFPLHQWRPNIADSIIPYLIFLEKSCRFASRYLTLCEALSIFIIIIIANNAE